jgi:hypothetical protein
VKAKLVIATGLTALILAGAVAPAHAHHHHGRHWGHARRHEPFRAREDRADRSGRRFDRAYFGAITDPTPNGSATDRPTIPGQLDAALNR